LVGVRTLAWRDATLMACGCTALAAAAIVGSYASVVIASALLGAIGAYYVTTALSRPAGETYDDSHILAAGTAATPSLDRVSQ
jgi:hypothetical protein